MKAGWTTSKINCWPSLKRRKRSLTPVSKKKRVRRDIEKFHRSGRYWELLRLLEAENAVSDHSKEHREAWQALTWQSVKDHSAFARFCAEVESLKKLPGDPDFRFLMLLKGFAENRNSKEEILQVKGLSPGAEKLRSNFAAFASDSGLQDGKLKVLLEKFVREPDKITRRYYEQLAGLLPGKPSRENVRRLGEYIPNARSLNGKGALSQGWDGCSENTLKRLDMKMFVLSKDLPSALRDIVLHPFVHNLAALCRRLAPETTRQQGAAFVQAMTFAFPRLAGERAAEIKSKLLSDPDKWSEEMDRTPASLQEELKGLELEARLSLLARLRRMVESGPSHAGGFGSPDFFDDDEDDEDEDEMEQEEREIAARLAKTLLMVYRNILGDLARRTPTLPPREQRELARVMEPILRDDLQFIFDVMEGPGDFVSFLRAILDAGCVGVRLGLLGLLAGARYRDRDLLTRAEKVLDQAAEPTVDDMKWLAHQWIELYYPSARSLRPMLQRYADRRELLLVLVIHLCNEVELELFEFTAGAQLPGILSDLFGGLGAQKPKNPGILRRELAELNDYDVLTLARLFLGCYPEDRLTIEGHLRWFNTIHSIHPGDFWKFCLDDIRHYEKLQERSRSLFPFGMPGGFKNDKVEALLLFMKEHSDELPMVPFDALGPLLDELLKHPKSFAQEQGLLIRLNNLLCARLDAGEEAVRPLLDEIEDILLSLAKPVRKPARKPARTRRKR
jgi:hypothetical protein